jgi:hypothetical protein
VVVAAMLYALFSRYLGGPAMAPWQFYGWVAAAFGGGIVAVSL